jgi:hypothetical protein
MRYLDLVLGARKTLVCGVALVIVGCASSSAPPGFLLSAEQELADAWGGWVEIHLTNSRDVLEGELIAVSEDSLYVLDAACPTAACRLTAIAHVDVRDGKVRGYDPRSGDYSLWTFLGVLSTGSHGYGMVLSAPLWILVGTMSAAAVSRSPDVYLDEPDASRARRFEPLPPEDELPHRDRVARYARFPQGLPHELRDTAFSSHPGSAR